MKNQEMIKIHLSSFHDSSFIAQVFFSRSLLQDKRLKVVAIKLHSLLMCINKLKFEEGSKKEMAMRVEVLEINESIIFKLNPFEAKNNGIK